MLPETRVHEAAIDQAVAHMASHITAEERLGGDEPSLALELAKAGVPVTGDTLRAAEGKLERAVAEESLREVNLGLQLALAHMHRVATSPHPVGAVAVRYAETIIAEAWQRVIDQCATMNPSQLAFVHDPLARAANDVTDAIDAVRARHKRDVQ